MRDRDDGIRRKTRAVGRVVDRLERRLGKRLADAEVDYLVKAVVNRPRIVKQGSVDLWGSGGRTGAEPLDTVSPGRHPPQEQVQERRQTEGGHPAYTYSRPLEGEDKLRDLVGKASVGTDSDLAEGESDDPTTFADGVGPAATRGGSVAAYREEDSEPATAYPPQPVVKGPLDRPVSLEVSDTFEDGPGVEPRVKRQQPPHDPRFDQDTRGAAVNLRVGAADAVALARLHKTMFRRTLRDRRYDLMAVEHAEDGSVQILEGQG